MSIDPAGRMRTIGFTLLLVCLLFPANALADARVALVIGNGSYTQVQPLRNPTNDAQLMAATLTSRGFEVVTTIDADRRGMAIAIRDFGKRLARAGPDAVGLFYYAGHGVQSRGANYLLPLRSEVRAEADLQIEAIDAAWILAQMEQAGIGLRIVILDACRDNPYGGSIRSAQRGLARLTAPSGSMVAYSAAPGQVALDGNGANSPYASALAEAMQRPGSELVRVFRETRLAVEENTDGAQTPWEQQSLRTDFYFTPETTQVAAISPDRGDAGAGAESGPLDAQVEMLFWDTVKDSRDPAELQTYIDAFPNGTFVALAGILIARLEAEAGGDAGMNPAPPGEDDREPALEDRPDKGFLGVRTQPVTEVLAEQVGLDDPSGAFITSVVAGSPANAAGLLIGDIITGFNGDDVTKTQPFPLLTDLTVPGQDVEVRIVRNGERLVFHATLIDVEEARRLVDAEDEAALERQASIGDAPGDMRPEVDPEAAEWFATAEKHYYGRGVPQSFEEALAWYRRAAERDHAEAIYSIGWMYAAGEGVARDHAEAARWHRRAADLGHAGARAELGYLYDNGLGVPRNAEEALRLYRLAADAGNARAMGNLAVMLDAGRGTPPDPGSAARFLLSSFVAGDQVTQAWLLDGLENWTPETRREVQRQLQQAGRYDGAIDGDIGPGTRRALNAYRSSQGG